MENIFIEFLPPWVETNLQPAFYDKESGTVLQQTARMYARVNMLIRMFNKLSKQTKEEIERFEQEVNETVEDYIERFNTLYNYVHDYFDNLDVQQEINNKLDQMLEDGVLEKIIEAFLQTNAEWCFESVADMKSATNFIDGSIAKTLGFYSAGDEGGAEYLIKAVDEADTIDDATIISISDQLNAHLIIKPEMSVKQFGCKGDDDTDDTTRFNIAIANSKKLIVNTGIYILNRFLPEEDQEVIGSKDAKIKVNGTTAPLVNFKSNSKIANLTIESVNEDLEWNRCDISNKSNITIENCSISGFRHDSLAPNAWGILVTASSDINIVNCYFDNNSQSDIAVVQDTDTINIERCSGTALFINFEPNNGNPIKNVTISNCNIDRLNLLENDLTKTSVRNAFIYACTINTIKYDGASVTFEDCRINNLEPEVSGGFAYGGNLRFINSANFSKNLINDPYLDTLKSDGTEWLLNYSPLAWASVVSASDDSDGRCIVLNQNNTATQISIKHSPIAVSAGDTYMLRLNSKEVTVASGAGYASCNLTVKYLDSGDQEVSSVRYSVNRHPNKNNDSGIGEISCILKVPEGATKMLIILLNSSYGTQSLYIRSVELYKISANAYNSNNLETLPVRKTRVFNASAQPSGKCFPYAVGDRLYYNDPSTNLGAVCTVAGTPGTWRNF